MDRFLVVVLLAGGLGYLYLSSGETSNPVQAATGRFTSAELALPRFLARIDKNRVEPRTSTLRPWGGHESERDFMENIGNSEPNQDGLQTTEPRVTSGFGFRRLFGVTRHHDGIDVAMPYGAPIPARWDGTVTFAGWRGGYGQAVILDHGNGKETLYAHASRLNVREGDFVSAGQTIARAGSTGRAFGTHLHFEVRFDGIAVDPEQDYLSQSPAGNQQ